MSIISRLFTGIPFTRTKFAKPKQIIDSVTPDLFNELKNSTKEFAKGVAGKDIEYIKNVASPELGLRLERQMLAAKEDELSELANGKYELDECIDFFIHPYVIFGEDINNRLANNSKVIYLMSNKYFKFNSQAGIGANLSAYKNKHIYGFNCFYTPQPKSNAAVHNFMTTFQTDSNNIQFFITDCQGLLLQQHAKSKS